MKILTKDQIFKADDLKTEVIEIPEWGGAVRVATMTGAGRDAFERSVWGADGQSRDLNNLRAKMVAATVVDDRGRLLFDSVEDVERLSVKSGAALDRIFAVARRLNRISPEDMEELEKNLPPTPNDNSIST